MMTSGSQANAKRTTEECVESGDRVKCHRNEDKDIHNAMDDRTCVNKGGRACSWVIICRSRVQGNWISWRSVKEPDEVYTSP
jgi:hypothetical protein